MAQKRTSRTSTSLTAVHNGLSITAHRSAGSVLLALNLAERPTDDFAGFAIKRTDPKGKSSFLLNRLNFKNAITATTAPEDREYTPSDKAPFQKFRWVDFPPDLPPDAPEGRYTYEATAMHFKKSGGLQAGESVSLAFSPAPEELAKFDFGFTRGFLSSQAYATRFKNAPIRPAGDKDIDFSTAEFEKRYEWLGFKARRMLFDFLAEAAADPTLMVDLFAYDLDEPDFIRELQKLGPRLRAYLDDATLHTKSSAVEPEAKSRLTASAGAANVKSGHFGRYAHNKVLILKKNGKPVKVLTGSTNFSVRGLYVQANNVLVFDDANVADLYEQAFEQAFSNAGNNASKFRQSPIAAGYFDIARPGVPKFGVAFSPHSDEAASLNRVFDAIGGAQSSVMFAIMDLSGGGKVLETIRNLDATSLFYYGVTEDSGGLSLFKPGSNKGRALPFSYLQSKTPPPFKAEVAGGSGQVVHHKFVVTDFNGVSPTVFTGSSNFAGGGEKDNGDNLLAISDRGIATAYAVEAVRLLDHYHFRASMKSATKVNPLTLDDGTGTKRWWADYYAAGAIKQRDRLLFSKV